MKQPPEVFYKKAALKNFKLFTGKHLCWSLFLITCYFPTNSGISGSTHSGSGNHLCFSILYKPSQKSFKSFKLKHNFEIALNLNVNKKMKKQKKKHNGLKDLIKRKPPKLELKD